MRYCSPTAIGHNNYTEQHPPPDLKHWAAFQVWMRTAGLPTFSKLALRNDNESMQIGRYEMLVYDCESWQKIPAARLSY